MLGPANFMEDKSHCFEAGRFRFGIKLGDSDAFEIRKLSVWRERERGYLNSITIGKMFLNRLD